MALKCPQECPQLLGFSAIDKERMKTCATCKHFTLIETATNEHSTGDCSRFPPAWAGDPCAWGFAHVAEWQFCGEHAEIEPEKAPIPAVDHREEACIAEFEKWFKSKGHHGRRYFVKRAARKPVGYPQWEYEWDSTNRGWSGWMAAWLHLAGACKQDAS